MLDGWVRFALALAAILACAGCVPDDFVVMTGLDDTPSQVRHAPTATAGIGLRHAADDLWPDATWLRGDLGYDFRPGIPGAMHLDLALLFRWGR